MLTVSAALQAHLDAQSTGLAYVVELRPRRNSLPTTDEIILDCDLQSESVSDQAELVHRVEPAIFRGFSDETSAVGVTRRRFGHSTVYSTHLDGTGSKLELGKGLPLFRSGAVAIEFRADELRNCDLLSIEKTDASATALRVRLTSSGNARVTLSTETTAASSGATYNVDTWHRLVVTYAGDGTGDDSAIKIYLDGVEVLSTTSTGHMADTVIPFAGLWLLKLGNNEAEDAAFKGRIGRVIVWTNATTTAPLDADDVVDIETHMKGPVIACSGDQPILDYALSVSEVAPIGGTLDPQTRAKKRDRFEITWADDGWLRYQKSRFRETSFGVAVKLAHSEIDDPDDYLLLANGYVEDGTPGDDFLNMTVREPEPSFELTVRGAFVGHPLEVARKILQASGTHPSKWDAESLDIANYPEIGHFQVARYGTPTLGYNLTLARDLQSSIEGSSIRPLLDELAMLCGGAFVADEGRLRFAKYDPSDAAVAHWTVDDVSDLEQTETISNLVNRYVLPAFFFRGNPLVTLTLEDEAAQLDSAIGGLEPRVSGQEASGREWVRSVATVNGDQSLSGSGPWTWDVISGALGMSGHGLSEDQRTEGGTQDAIYQLGGGKYAYYMLGRTEHDANQPNPAVEIVRVDDVSLLWGSGLTLYVSGVPNPVTQEVEYFPRDSEIQIGARAQYGTQSQTEQYRGYTYLADVTLPLYALGLRLARFSRGCPVLRFRTNLAKIAVNLGEFVTLEDELVLDFELDGVDTSTKWEVIGKEVDVLGDTLGILWTVAKVVDESPELTASRTAGSMMGLTALVGSEALPLRVADPDSFVVTHTTDLEFSVSSGRAGTLAGEVDGPAFEASVEPSKDSYLGFDVSTGLFVLASVDNSDPPPTFDAAILPVATIVSDGTEITTIIRTCPTAGLADGSVHIDQLSSDVADEDNGLIWGDNGLRVLVDGVTVGINGDGELEAAVGITGTLTSGRVAVASGAASLTDYANFTYDGTTLTAPTVSATSQVRVGTTWAGVQCVSAGQTGTPPGTQPSGTLSMIIGNDATNASQLIETYGTSVYPELRLRKARGTRASPTSAASGDTIGRIVFGGYDGSTGAYRDVAWIDGVLYNTLSGTSNSGAQMVFSIFEAGQNATQEMMRFIGGSRNGSASIRFTPEGVAGTGYGSSPLVVWTMPSESSNGVNSGAAYDFYINLNRTKRYQSSTYASSYQVYISDCTLSSNTTTTHTKTGILYVGSPVVGTGSTFTQAYSIETGGRLMVGAAGTEAQPAIVLGGVQTGLYGSSTTLLFSIASNRRMYLDDGVDRLILDNGWAIASGTSAANPAYCFGTDTDTGLQYVSADVFGVKTANAERLRWHSDGDISIPGDVVIGAAVGTNPGYKLEIQGSFRTSGTNTLDGTIDHNGTTIGFFSATPVVQQTVGAVTNSVTSGGTDGTIADYTIVDYATDGPAIKDNFYQLGRSVAQLATAVRNLGLAA